MNPPYELFLFGVAFFGFMAVVGVVQAHRKREKTYYLSAMVCFVMLLAFIFFFLNQPILALTIIITAGILSIVELPKMLKVRERELTKRLQEKDFSAPLRKRYFLSDIWWLKLASKWGLRKTICLFYLVSMSLSGGILLILSTLYSFITVEYVLVYAPIFSILFTFMYYQPFQRALKRKPYAKPDSEEM
jgi:NADH:ubiquinone oxidoreductase subunit 6 (subunit J)